MMSYVGRLAPAPTGALHLGNARTFLVAWLRARRAGGRLVLRLENLDHPKVKPTAARDAYKDLTWLGLDWDEGPAGSFPPFSEGTIIDPYIQSHRLHIYARALDTLREAGMVYPCVCTRKDLDSYQSAPNSGEDLVEKRYPGRCRDRFTDADAARLHNGQEPGWRFRVRGGVETSFLDGLHGHQASILSEWSGDFLIARGDRAGYQLAVVVDDHEMGISEVVRGDDLIPSTHRQLAIYQALGIAPPRFLHVPLVIGEDGRRLAKRHGDTRMGILREKGVAPERVLGWLAHSCGWSRTLREMSLAEIAKKCDFSQLPRERVVVSGNDRRWLGF